MACGFQCSAAQGAYVELFATRPRDALYRVCAPACAAAYAACVVGTFEDEPVALRFESATELCRALPLGDGVDIEVVAGSDGTCFRSRETEQRALSVVFGEAMGGGLTLAEHRVHVRALDGFGQPVAAGGDELVAALLGPDTLAPRVLDHNNGSYTVLYAPDIGGYYDVSVRVEGELAARMPERVSVQPASLCPLRGDLVNSAKPRFDSAPSTCSQYNENSCCLTQGDYSDVARDIRDFSATYRNNEECTAFFEMAACGVHCSPGQATVSLFF